MTDIDIPLLRKAVEWVEEQDSREDSQWCQASWVLTEEERLEEIEFLATSIANDDWGPDHVDNMIAELDSYRQHVDCGTTYCVAGYVQLQKTGSEDSYSAFETAQRELGLSTNQAKELFKWNNTAADVRRIAEKFAGERL